MLIFTAVRGWIRPAALIFGAALIVVASSGWLAAETFSIPNTAKYIASVGAAVAFVVITIAKDPRLPATFLMVMSLPLAGISTTVGPLTVSVLAVTATLAVALMILRAAPREASSPVGSVEGRWWLWVLACFAPSVILGANAWPTVSTVLMGVGIGWIVCRAVRIPGGVAAVTAAVLISAAGQSVIGLYQYLTGAQLNFYSGSATARGSDYFFNYDGVSRATGTLPHPLAAGNYLAIAIPLVAMVVVRAFAQKRYAVGGVACLTLLLVVAGLLTTLARASLIGTGLGLALMAVLVPRRIGALMALGGVLALAVLLNAAALTDDPAVTARFSSIFDPTGIGVETSDGDETRMMLWQIAFQSWMDNPVFGVGLGSLNQVFLSSLPGTDSFTHAHNLYLQIGAESGLCGLAALAIVLSRITAAARRAHRVDPVVTAGVVGAIVAALAGSMTDTTALTGVGVAGAVGTALGILWGQAGVTDTGPVGTGPTVSKSNHQNLSLIKLERATCE